MRSRRRAHRRHRTEAHDARVELNEAFAAQVLACRRELDLPLERLNVNGGAIALGHPIGATGARIVVTLLHEIDRREVARGLATLCVSAAWAYAMAFHRDGLRRAPTQDGEPLTCETSRKWASSAAA